MKIAILPLALMLASCSGGATYEEITAVGVSVPVGPKCPSADVTVHSTSLTGAVRLYFVPQTYAEQAEQEISAAGGIMGRWALFNSGRLEVEPGNVASGVLQLPAQWCADGGRAFLAVEPVSPGVADINFEWSNF